jgi:hypothetical protein
MKAITKLIHTLFLLFLLIIGNSCGNNDKLIIGAVAEVYIEEGNINFVGRVDTGAKTTSINARNIYASNGFVEYVLINRWDKEARIKSKIVKESYVKSAEAREKRYYVYLTINYMGLSKKTLVNLNDRSLATHKMLLGRNWLSGSYIVDIDKHKYPKGGIKQSNKDNPVELIQSLHSSLRQLVLAVRRL